MVYPKKGISDPEGDTLRERLVRKGITRISSVRSGRYWEVSFNAESREDAIAYIRTAYLNPPMINPVKDESELLALEEVK